MSRLLEAPPYAPRDDALLLGELNALVAHHRTASPTYARLTANAGTASRLEDLPFVHAGMFKRVDFGEGAASDGRQRTVLSSSTSGVASRIRVDERSSQLQARSTQAILGDFAGEARRPLLVLDSAASLRSRNEFSARIMAAMSLKAFASEVFFLLRDAADPASMQWTQLECALKPGGPLIVYGFTWMLWLAWARQAFPAPVLETLAGREITFVHSGGWKKLEDQRVDRAAFESELLARCAPGSRVVEYYGLVEQLGVVFPVCGHGAMHVPRWADVIVRDSWTLAPLADEPGQLQLLNAITFGTPAHSVLTEDIGRLLPGECACGRAGRRFELLGRVPKAELRGCANVG